MIKFFFSQFSDWRIVVKYGISGCTAVLFQLLVLVFFVEIVGMWHLAAATVAFFAGACVAFTLQKFWTFKDRSLEQSHFQISYFVLLAAAAALLNAGLMYVFVDILGIYYVIAQIVTLVFVTLFTFITNKNVIFNRQSAIFKKKQDTIGQ